MKVQNPVATAQQDDATDDCSDQKYGHGFLQSHKKCAPNNAQHFKRFLGTAYMCLRFCREGLFGEGANIF